MIVFIPSLVPRSKNIAGGKYSLQGDNGFNNVSTVEADLPVNGTGVEHQRVIPAFGTAVVSRGIVPSKGDSDRHRQNIHNSNQGR